MVCAEFHGKKMVLAHSCRSTMLHYRSTLLDTIYTFVFSPFLLFGTIEEKQDLKIELFSDYQENDLVNSLNNNKHFKLFK